MGKSVGAKIWKYKRLVWDKGKRGMTIALSAHLPPQSMIDGEGHLLHFLLRHCKVVS